MKRKQFLSSLLPLAALQGLPDLFTETEGNSLKYRIPSPLKAGDTIGITCTGGPVSIDDVLPAIKKIESWGFTIRLGKNPGKRYLNFGGTDRERQEELQQMLDDNEIRAILFARGGYGTVRIVDNLDFKRFIENPKWLVGFSDITYLHAEAQRRNVASIHSKMCNSFPAEGEEVTADRRFSIESIKNALTGVRATYQVASNNYNIAGKGIGPLIGGNLRILESLAGTPTSLNTDGCILFLEDTMEYLYSIDRMFWNLLRSGKLQKLQGLIVGGFRIKPDDAGEEFGMSLEEIILEKVRPFGYPVCFGFPVGHQAANMALKCGVSHQLTVNADAVLLEEY